MTHLLAETEFPSQLILFGIVVVFSFLKWLFQKVTGNGAQKVERDEDVLESLYDSYRETIIQRQSATETENQEADSAWLDEPVVEQTPPQLEPQISAVNPPHSSTPAFSYDLEKIPEKLEVAPPVEPSQRQKKRQSSASILSSLQNKSELRKAIILQEVLQKPKALR